MLVYNEFGIDFVFPVFDHVGIFLIADIGGIRKESFLDTLFFEGVTIILGFEGQSEFHGIGYRGVDRGTVFLRGDFLGISNVVLC